MLYFSTPIEDITDDLVREVCTSFSDNEIDLGLQEAVVLVNFPVYRDADDEGVPVPLVLISPMHGAVLFNVSDEVDPTSERFEDSYNYLTHAYRLMLAKLFRNKALASGRLNLAVPFDALMFAPLLREQPQDSELQLNTLMSIPQLLGWLRDRKREIPSELYQELLATGEGSKALQRPRKRPTFGKPSTDRGPIALEVEKAIAKFDQFQRRSYALPIRGPERIRGLAGSGKTAVLAMKAAKLHNENRSATIVYTFWTRSLYQHVRKLISNFWKMYSEESPDWSKLKVMHGWGASDMSGVYRDVCQQFGIRPTSFTEATQLSRNPFDFVCKDLVNKIQPKGLYDYVLIDEGQDFPTSFVQLCSNVTADGRFVLAYDALQTIFQPTVPTESDIFGVDAGGTPLCSFAREFVLPVCYRNPRAILVVAHAIGFGIYAPVPGQMLEDENHWNDIGYRLVEGELKTGSRVKLLRPAENSLELIGDKQTVDQLVQMTVCDSPAGEAKLVADCIYRDVQQGLSPDDVLVISVDDRNAKTYLQLVERELLERNIFTNNVHNATNLGVRDFQIEDHVTLSTVHKAKGNEAFSVYVVGADAPFAAANVRSRNILFTAITRAKAWVHLTGVGEFAKRLAFEIDQAKKNFPFLEFTYPDPSTISKIKRDLTQVAVDKRKAEKELSDIVAKLKGEMTLDEIRDFIQSQMHAEEKKESFEELQD